MPGFGEIYYPLWSPVGTTEGTYGRTTQPSLQDFRRKPVRKPGVETPGYSQMSLRDRSWPVNGYEKTASSVAELPSGEVKVYAKGCWWSCGHRIA